VKRECSSNLISSPDIIFPLLVGHAMTTLLVINSSVSGVNSVSRVLVAHAVAEFAKATPGARIVRRDVGETPIPHLTAKTLAGVRGTPQTESELRTRQLSDELIAELRAADTIIIGAPMYNFGVPTGLRAWFDHVLRAGETFSYSEAGPQGLLTGKHAIVIESRGGLYSEGPAKAIDFQEPYLRQLLGFIGVTDVTFIRAEKIGSGAQARDAAIATARMQLTALARQSIVLAA
jgi:FMN-dependent NADH-azoreductase